MIKGIGVDIVQHNRIKLKIAPKVLVPSELNKFNTLNDELKVEFLASRFASKEAIIKATNKAVKFSDIEISNDDSGSPIVNIENIKLSISHEQEYSIAFAIWED